MGMLSFDWIGHAAWGNDVCGPEANDIQLSACANIRFKRRVRLDTFYLYPVEIRWAPATVGQPRHLLVQTYQSETDQFAPLMDIWLPRFTAHEPHAIALDGIETDNLRIICDKEHKVNSSHGEQWASEDVVPFSILNHMAFHGEELTPIVQPAYYPPLKRLTINPYSNVAAIDVDDKKGQISYKSKFFSVSFSLRRPIITHMGWDDLGLGRADENLIYSKPVWLNELTTSGLVYQGTGSTVTSYVASGEVEVIGTRITYRNVRLDDRWTTDYCFEINELGMDVQLSKTVIENVCAYELDDFRFSWDIEKSLTGTLSVPCGKKGRTGLAPFPIMWNAPGHGCLEVRDLGSGSLVDTQTDTWRDKRQAWCGIMLGANRDEYGFVRIAKGHYAAHLSMKVRPVLPNLLGETVPNGLLRNWSSGLTFRTELAGFSNNAVSCNCHVSQFHPADFVPFTREDDDGLSYIDMLAYTVEIALRGGPGYGDCRDMYMDSDPSLLIAAGRVYQIKRDQTWLRSIFKYVTEAFDRIMANTDESGLLVCRSLSGNSGTKRWSSNAWDVVSFGHYDAYSNAHAYRALKNVAGMAKAMGYDTLADDAGKAADKLKNSYMNILTNPDTGLVSGWVSADGMHHDYAFTFINYMAISYGLADAVQSRQIMETLENMMEEKSLDYFHYGIPTNLISIRNSDAPTGNDYLRDDGLDKYGVYVNGSLSTCWMLYYLYALDKYGYTEKVIKVTDDLLHAFLTSEIVKGYASGTEFFTWDGRACGYEGVLVGCYPVQAGIGIARGWLEKLNPMWWIE